MKSLKGSMSATTFTDKQNLNLLVRINKSRQLHLVPCTLNGKYVLRFSVNYEFSTPEMISKLTLSRKCIKNVYELLYLCPVYTNFVL